MLLMLLRKTKMVLTNNSSSNPVVIAPSSFLPLDDDNNKKKKNKNGAHLEVDDEALLSPPRLVLADNDSRADLLAELGLKYLKSTTLKTALAE